MLTTIVRAPRPLPLGPTTPLDHEIVALLQDGRPREPREIQTALLDGVQLRSIHLRLRVLRQRGVLTRTRLDGGPRRGPGAGVYTLTTA